jgi:hypothetical protein
MKKLSPFDLDSFIVRWEQSLVQSGLLASIPPRPTGAPRQFEPVRIQGEPLSETIIRERR